MSKFQITFPNENAFECLRELGVVEKCHFVYAEENYIPCDLFIKEVMLCNSLLSTLHYMENYLDEHKIAPVFYPKIDDEQVPEAADLSTYENEITAAEEQLKSFVFYDVDLHRRREMLQEQSMVLDSVNKFFGVMNTDNAIIVWTDELAKRIKDKDATIEGENKLSFFFGTMSTESFHSFEKMIFRLTRGSFLIKNDQIVLDRYEPLKGEEKVRKTVFMICFIGQEMGNRIYKVIAGYHGQLYDIPSNKADRMDMKSKCDEDINDLDLLLPMSNTERTKLEQLLKERFFIWKVNLKKIMTIYAQLNKFEILAAHSKKFYLQGNCWIPKDAIITVRTALADGTMKAARAKSPMGLPVPIITPKALLTEEVAPTEFDLNGFTKGFQKLIDSYGMATYKELNPTPYTIITFPFLFAVMFGDLGHGLIVAIFATVLIKKHKKYLEASRAKKSRNEIADIVFAGRYIILLMGIFSCYTGLIYNDMFSKPTSIFGNSHWRVSFTAAEVNAIPLHGKIDLDPTSPKNYIGDPYYFGIDPVWKSAGDESIVTFNSIKMKLSVILGVFHMLFGLILAAVNNRYFKNKIDLFLLTIPQILLFSSLFVYLTFMIFFKWAVFGGHNPGIYSPGCAPSVLITFINMFLMKPAVAPENCSAFLYGGQEIVQYCLMGVAMTCMPILLAGKPIYFHLLKRRIKRMKDRHDKRQFIERTNLNAQKSLVYNVEYSRPSSISRSSIVEPNQADFDMWEVWIHSGIHAIDSILGAISHTASYLRLWALSLAHEQLSHVLWKMILARSFTTGLSTSYCFFIIVPVFFIWSILTISILVTMEGLSAFLHTLRLHWVEFQSKFYSGTGIAFSPFQFEKSSMNR